MFAGRGLKKIINVFTDSFDKERAILSENGRAKKEGGWELFLLSFAKRSQKSFKRVRKVQNFINRLILESWLQYSLSVFVLLLYSLLFTTILIHGD